MAKTPTARTTKTSGSSPKRTAARRTEGTARLVRYLENHHLSLSQFAELVGCTKSYVHYMATGASSPGLQLAIKIEDVTKGYVGCWCWMKPEGGKKSRSAA